MKRVYGKKGRCVLGSAMLLLTLLLTGCADSENEKGKISESISSVDRQETLVIQNTEVQEEEQVTQDDLQEQAFTPSEKPIQENNVPVQETEAESQTITKYTTSISGNVESVGNGSFVISQINTSKASDGSDLAIKSDEEITLITVNYTETTEFVICSSSDGGKTSSETTASSQALANGKHIMLEGAWNQNDFTAQKVTIYNFN